MNEDHWLTWWDAFDLLSWCEDDAYRLSERKLRLFAAARCRTIWPLLNEDMGRRAVEAAERFADGQATLEELQAIHNAAEGARWAAEPIDETLLREVQAIFAPVKNRGHLEGLEENN